MDFVLRDAYMCGLPPPFSEVRRLLLYSRFAEGEGLVLHMHALLSLASFLQTRMHLFSAVYYHRTVRAIELHMREVFRETIESFWPELNPREDLERYVNNVDEWSLMSKVQERIDACGSCDFWDHWRRVVNRDPRWKNVFEYTQSRAPLRGQQWLGEEYYQRHLEDAGLGDMCRASVCRIEPIQSGDMLKIWNPLTDRVDETGVHQLRQLLPEVWQIVRVFSLDRSKASEVQRVMSEALHSGQPLHPTNI